MSGFVRTCFSKALLTGIAGVGMGACVAIAVADQAQAQAWPRSVDATYRISFNGFNLGSFRFVSQLRSNRYKLRGDARLSAALGAFRWRAVTESRGWVSRGRPSPRAYAASYAGNSKSGTLDMRFSGGRVKKVAARPHTSSGGRVPVTKSHLRGVLDPMSAVMTITRARRGRVRGANPCRGRVPIFDGKQRFDLVLSLKRRTALSGQFPGASGIAYVCRVRYVPIAGYKRNRATTYMARTREIELWLRPVPTARVFIPHFIRIPVTAGLITITASRVDIETRGRGRIALVN